MTAVRGKSGPRGSAKYNQWRESMRRQSPAILGSLLLIAGFIASLPAFIILMVGLIPTIVAGLAGRMANSGGLHCLFGFNLAGILPVIAWLWREGNNMKTATQLLGDPLAWYAMYGAAMLGGAVAFVLPRIVALVYEQRAQRLIAAHRMRQQKMIEEWGLDLVSSALGEATSNEEGDPSSREAVVHAGITAQDPEEPPTLPSSEAPARRGSGASMALKS